MPAWFYAAALPVTDEILPEWILWSAAGLGVIAMLVSLLVILYHLR